MMTEILKRTLNMSKLKVVFDFSWANTAALKPMHKIVIKNTKVILMAMDMSCINKSITAAEPKQLWPMMAIAA